LSKVKRGQDWQQSLIKLLRGGSIIVQDAHQNILFSHHANKAMVPASILKIATADAVLSQLGKNFKIKTEFYLTNDHYLAIKGFGDPTLVSESLKMIAVSLKKQLAKQSWSTLKGFYLDTSYFKPHLKVDGQSNTQNPYDSSVGALVANFNTVYIKKLRNGTVQSAETQTPLTPTAKLLAKNLPIGKHRINIGKKSEMTLRYFAELLQFFLAKEGIQIPLSIIHQRIPESAHKILIHQSQPITDIVHNLLLFSNNFTANQLLIILGGEVYGAPANLHKGKQVVKQFLLNTIGINGFVLEEGSGLSRKNQLSAKQMLKILQHFKPYQQLLRIDNHKFQAKTGTLKGISTYAGYLLSSDKVPENESYPFVIMMDNARWGGERKKIAHLLYHGIFQ
jgi:D-alanyl-D-alanine carboxypeptidase/D-alanyl-D-alanine-endopeptidase (penicillin-binding protein 4)